jgi:gamma-glutamyltranspeptidase/glutathione hydrolase
MPGTIRTAKNWGQIQAATAHPRIFVPIPRAAPFGGRRYFGNAEPTGEASESIGTVEMESGFSPATKAELARRDYKFADGTGNFGGYQAILWDPVHRVYWSASEMRKDG